MNEENDMVYVFLPKWRQLIRISNGWAFRFQIPFKIWTICNPTYFYHSKSRLLRILVPHCIQMTIPKLEDQVYLNNRLLICYSDLDLKNGLFENRKGNHDLKTYFLENCVTCFRGDVAVDFDVGG